MEERVLQVAQAAAGISDLIRVSGDLPGYAILLAGSNGFPGIWAICGDAAVALENAIQSSSDPDCESHNYIDCIASMARYLLVPMSDKSKLGLGIRASIIFEESEDK